MLLVIPLALLPSHMPFAFAYASQRHAVHTRTGTQNTKFSSFFSVFTATYLQLHSEARYRWTKNGYIHDDGVRRDQGHASKFFEWPMHARKPKDILFTARERMHLYEKKSVKTWLHNKQRFYDVHRPCLVPVVTITIPIHIPSYLEVLMHFI